MLRNSSGCCQVVPIWPVHGSAQACTLEPCRNQARWNGLAVTMGSNSAWQARNYRACRTGMILSHGPQTYPRIAAGAQRTAFEERAMDTMVRDKVEMSE